MFRSNNTEQQNNRFLTLRKRFRQEKTVMLGQRVAQSVLKNFRLHKSVIVRNRVPELSKGEGH